MIVIPNLVGIRGNSIDARSRRLSFMRQIGAPVNEKGQSTCILSSPSFRVMLLGPSACTCNTPASAHYTNS